MRIVIGGASGFVGTELLAQLTGAGHEVVRLVRREAGSGESRWDPARGEIDAAVVEAADAVITLSGASLAQLPWPPRYRRELVSSRLQATSTLAAAISAATAPPTTFLSGSAVGFYGDRPNENLTEQSRRGTGFLADLVEQWEHAAHQVPSGVRVVTLRTGIVVGRGGAFAPLELLTRLGLGSRLGGADIRWPWISLHDEAAAIVHLLDSNLSGPVNLVGPTPATQDAITRHLAVTLHRPRWFAIPSALVSLGMGAAGRELLLPSQRVVPENLMADGFGFRDETVESAIRAVWPARP